MWNNVLYKYILQGLQTFLLKTRLTINHKGKNSIQPGTNNKNKI